MGHEVTVFAVDGSDVDGSLIATLPGPYGVAGSPDDWHLCEWINLCVAVQQSGRFDVLHSHGYLWGLPLEPLSKASMVHTLHVVPSANEARLRAMWPQACVTALSHYQWSAFPEVPLTPVVYNAVDSSLFHWVEHPDDYLVYLGRFMPGKGPLAAIEAAQAVGMPLVLAGPENGYYREKIAPLVAGSHVRYAGSVTGEARSRLLGHARALLYPLSEPEPFGMVMIEAMMCGTPVAALRIGAVPEVVDEGVTGHIAESPEGLPRQIERAVALDRRVVRRRAQDRFSGERMAREYLGIYEELMGSRK
jgi:glycosyltransferase involved in cell wall biosynthesis